MQIFSKLKNLFTRESKPQGPWRTVTQEYAFTPLDVFESAKTIRERQELAPGTLAPGQRGVAQNPAERELREKVVFKNGTVITEDVAKKEVTIQPKDVDPIVLHDATLVIDATGITIENPNMKQNISRSGSFTVYEPKQYKKYGQKVQSYYMVPTYGTVSGAIYHRFADTETVQGELTPEGYIKAGPNLIAPFVQQKYILNPAKQ